MGSSLFSGDGLTRVESDSGSDGDRMITGLMERIDEHRVVFPGGGTARVDNTALVRTRAKLSSDEWSKLGLFVLREILSMHDGRTWWTVRSRTPGEDGLDVALRLRSETARSHHVDAAEPNLWIRRSTLDASEPHIPPDDPRYAAQYFWADIDMEAAWNQSVGAEDVGIVVVDNGCDLAHADLADKMLPGLDVVDDDDDPTFFPQSNGNEHGTACAGLAAAITDNGVDVAGACPLCSLSCVRLLGDVSSEVPLDADVRAFAFALESNAAVVSNSWGFIDAIPVPQALADAIAEVQT